MITAVIVMTLIGTVSAICLAVASRYFSVAYDPAVDEINSLLSGANCGGCGHAGCAALAKAIAAGEALANSCPGLSEDALAKISAITGAEATNAKHIRAFVKCRGGKNCTDKYKHFGLTDCLTMSLTEGGQKSCLFGCLGGGNCVHSCPFNAIYIDDSGVAAVDISKCTGCGMCVQECPKNLIVLTNYRQGIFGVSCSSVEKGADVRKKCTVGCIGCKLCEKACKYGAISVDSFLALIDVEKCTSCAECVKVCPVGAIKEY